MEERECLGIIYEEELSFFLFFSSNKSLISIFINLEGYF